MFREVLEDILFISKFYLWKINAMIIEVQIEFNFVSIYDDGLKDR